MFVEAHELVRDLERYVANGGAFSENWQPVDDEVGAALIAVATNRVPRALAASYGEAVSANHQIAARRFIASQFFALGASHYRVLGVLPVSSSEQLRTNYRRLMALVHPDAKPVGFPLDAAARVNLAYSVLSDTHARQRYDEAIAREFSAAVSVRSTAATAVHTYPDIREGIVSDGWTARLRRSLPRLGFRKGLFAVALASCLAVALLWSSLMPSESVVRLVESRPKLTVAPQLASPGAPAHAVPATQDSVTPQIVSAPSQEAPVAALRLATQLDVGRVATATQRRAIIASAASNNPSDPLARHAPELSVPTERSAPPPETSPEIVVAKLTTERMAQRSVESPDVDQVMAQFASAFETGSTALLSATLSAAMPSRENVLAEYERVFRQTKQRSIRFNSVKHTSIADNRTVSSGLATVITTDLSDRNARQRVFLEIETAREPVGSRIVRLANYEQK